MSTEQDEEKSLHLQTQALVELARSGAVRQSLEAAFEQITSTAAGTLDVDRVSIWLYDEDRSAICCADLYERGQRRHARGVELRAADFPAYFKALETERTIAAHDARSDPRTREFTSAYLEPLGITSMLDAPQLFAGSIADAASLAFEESERRRADAERERLLVREQAARAEAEEANRTKDEFLATVSHELRTPLNAMLGWVHLLRSGSLDATTSERALEIIERNIQAQAQIVDDILDVSRIVRGGLTLSVRSIDLAAVLHQAIESLRPAAQAKGIALHTVLDPADSHVTGDPGRLQQVLWNLLANAIKFTPRGGEVTVRLSRKGDELRLEVSDTGEGIGSDFLPHVFERFRQANGSTTRMHGGLGLGLAIVRHLVELHGGTVEAESAGHGRGARFTVTLPARPAAGTPDEDLPGC